MQRHCYALKNASACGLLQPEASLDDDEALNDMLMSSAQELEVNIFFCFALSCHCVRYIPCMKYNSRQCSNKMPTSFLLCVHIHCVTKKTYDHIFADKLN